MKRYPIEPTKTPDSRRKVLMAQEIADVIEAIAPLSWQESYDNAGFILGEPCYNIKKVLVCTDITNAVVDEAIACKANMIVAHHPPIFKGLKNIEFLSPMGRMLRLSMQYGIVWYAAHTNFDNAAGGPNAYWADKLGLTNRTILKPLPGMDADVEGGHAAGMGLCGDLPRAMSEENLLKKLKAWSGSPCIRHSKLIMRNIRRVAICTGAGSSLLQEAWDNGAQVLITGEARYHDFVEGEGSLLVEIGHFESEQVTKQLFYECIKKKFPTFAVRISEAEHCPVCYF